MAEFKLIKKRDQIPIPTRQITHIGIHHSASSWGDGRTIDHWHRTRPDPFREIGYHFVIHNGTFYPMGFIETGREIGETPAAHAPKNSNSIAICVIGNFSQTVIDNNLDARAMSLAFLVNELRFALDLPIYNDAAEKDPAILGHREIKPTQCPGLNIDLKIMRDYFKFWSDSAQRINLKEWYEGALFMYEGTKDQIAAVQRILNLKHGAGLVVDGILGPKTHGAWTDATSVETFSSRAGEVKGWELILREVERL